MTENCDVIYGYIFIKIYKCYRYINLSYSKIKLYNLHKPHRSKFEPHAFPDCNLDICNLKKGKREVFVDQVITASCGLNALAPVTSYQSLDGRVREVLDLVDRDVAGQVGLGPADEAGDPCRP